MKTTGAAILTHLLERQGVGVVAGIPGGANLPLYDALHTSPIRHVLARHEQGAGFIAQGMARATGSVAVCLGTSGPGATNLVTAVADAMLDSIPLVVITGQVATHLIGTDAFQEVHTLGLALPVTKHSWLVRDARDLLRIVPEAFRIASSGRPGPVWIDVPKDVQTQEIDFDEWPAPAVPDPRPHASDVEVDRLARMIEVSKRPVILAGGGIIASGAADGLREIVRTSSIPVASTLHGLGAFPADDPRFLGMVGMHGSGATNRVLDEADLLLAFGIRFDDRATGKASEFCRQAKIAHVDVDASEIGKIKRPDLGIAADVGDTLGRLHGRLSSRRRREWNRRVSTLKRQYPLPGPDVADLSHPLSWLCRLADQLGPDGVVTTDVGQHQMWVAQAWPFRRPRTLLTSGGLGTMGFGLPAAIGAALARPGRRVVCVSGEGSILMNLQELDTLVELGLDVTVLVLNNGSLGLVRQQQELFYGRRFHACRFDTRPDFAAIARGFGLRGMRLPERTDPASVLFEAVSVPGPCLVDLPVPAESNVLPMVPPGAANRDMIGESPPEEAPPKERRLVKTA